MLETNEKKDFTFLYCDGGILAEGSMSSSSNFGGAWAFVATDEDDEIVFSESGFIRLEDRPTTNNHTEMYAAIKALESAPNGWNGILFSDSELTLGRLFKGWTLNNLPEDFIHRFKSALDRLGIVIGQHLKGHPTKKDLKRGYTLKGRPVSRWNKMCDDLCQQEVKKAKQKLNA